MYKVTVNGEKLGVYKDNEMHEIGEKVVEALNKGGKKIYIEEVETDEN